MKTKKTMSPIQPGEILRIDFLEPLDLSQARLAQCIGVSARRVRDIVNGRCSISADVALRLARFFGTTEMFWLNLQVHHDLEIEKDRLGDRLEVEVQRLVLTG
jgi:antitoxin HigA-1